jgi:hypothetical protein
MRLYYLSRNEDVSGTSGTGHIAEVAEFDDGAVVVRWIGAMNMSGVTSTTVFSSLNDLLRIHGHEGRTVVELVIDTARVQQMQDTINNLRECLREATDELAKHGLPVKSCS